MAGAVFERGPISFEVVKPVTKRRLVKLGEKGVEHAGAADDVFGATVTDEGYPQRCQQPHNWAGEHCGCPHFPGCREA